MRHSWEWPRVLVETLVRVLVYLVCRPFYWVLNPRKRGCHHPWCPRPSVGYSLSWCIYHYLPPEGLGEDWAFKAQRFLSLRGASLC